MQDWKGLLDTAFQAKAEEEATLRQRAVDIQQVIQQVASPALSEAHTLLQGHGRGLQVQIERDSITATVIKPPNFGSQTPDREFIFTLRLVPSLLGASNDTSYTHWTNGQSESAVGHLTGDSDIPLNALTKEAILDDFMQNYIWFVLGYHLEG